jgi:hypothetical protein
LKSVHARLFSNQKEKEALPHPVARERERGFTLNFTLFLLIFPSVSDLSNHLDKNTINYYLQQGLNP